MVVAVVVVVGEMVDEVRGLRRFIYGGDGINMGLPSPNSRITSSKPIFPTATPYLFGSPTLHNHSFWTGPMPWSMVKFSGK